MSLRRALVVTAAIATLLCVAIVTFALPIGGHPFTPAELAWRAEAIRQVDAYCVEHAYEYGRAIDQMAVNIGKPDQMSKSDREAYHRGHMACMDAHKADYTPR